MKKDILYEEEVYWYESWYGDRIGWIQKTTGELKEGLISIASMLNKNGKGTLYFGVRNDGEIIGQQIGDRTMREISQGIANAIKPQIIPTIVVELCDDKNIIKVAAVGDEKPYSAYGKNVMIENLSVYSYECLVESLFCTTAFPDVMGNKYGRYLELIDKDTSWSLSEDEEFVKRLQNKSIRIENIIIKLSWQVADEVLESDIESELAIPHPDS